MQLTQVKAALFAAAPKVCWRWVDCFARGLPAGIWQGPLRVLYSSQLCPDLI